MDDNLLIGDIEIKCLVCIPNFQYFINIYLYLRFQYLLIYLYKIFTKCHYRLKILLFVDKVFLTGNDLCD